MDKFVRNLNFIIDMIKIVIKIMKENTTLIKIIIDSKATIKSKKVHVYA